MIANSPPVPELTTERLLLRAPDKKDIPAWFARATDHEAAALAGDVVPLNLAEGEAWLNRSLQRARDGQRFQWSIDWPENANCIGTVALSLKTNEISFVLGRVYWGHGFATEAARAVMDYALVSIGLKTLNAQIVARNDASRRVLTKLGFHHVRSFIDSSDGEHCEAFAITFPQSI